jgi:hypothetical protein
VITILPDEAQPGEHLECEICWCDPLVIYCGEDGERLEAGPMVIHNDRVDAPQLREPARIILP